MIVLFKIKVVSQVLLHLLAQMIWFALVRVFRNKQYQNAWLHKKVVLWAAMLISALRIDFKISGRDTIKKIDWFRNIFAVANHQSYADIPIIYASFQKMFGFIAKYELSRIPFLKYWMTIQGCVFINRARFISAIKTLKKLEKSGKTCRLVIFPEGTRSKDGNLGRFKSGGLKMAWEMDAILAPLTITGTRDSWENLRFARCEHPVSVAMHAPIDLREIKKNTTFKNFIKSFESDFAEMYKPG